MLCGDAAGQINPLTGAGIFPAISCAQMAAKAAASSLLHCDEAVIASYDKNWRGMFEAFLKRGLVAAQELHIANRSEHQKLIRQAWAIK